MTTAQTPGESISESNNTQDNQADIVLIGAGIMSATLGMMLRELHPAVSIRIYERLDVAAAESSDAWNMRERATLLFTHLVRICIDRALMRG